MSNDDTQIDPSRIKTLKLYLGAPEVYSDDEIIAAFEAYRGRITHASNALGCSSGVLHDRVNRSPKIREALTRIRYERVDRAENKLDDAIDHGEPWAISLVLKTIGKDRGYVERAEITGKDGTELFGLDHIVVVEHGIKKLTQEAPIDGVVEEIPELVNGITGTDKST